MGQLSLLSLLKKQHQEQKFQELDQQQLEQESNEKIQIKLLDFINLHQNLSIKDVYEILPSKLGIGSQSVVKIGLHKVLGITRAIKIIDKSTVLIGDISTVLHEAEILKQLDHPNVIKILEFYQNSKQIFIVTELCNGGELIDAIVESDKFSEKDTIKLMKQVLQGLNYCHQHKIVHRNINPSDILFDNKDKRDIIKIIDFETSRIFDQNQKMTQRIGTPYYIAPEVLERNYDQKCDIWSCGVLTYILLSRSPPFNGESEAQVLERVKQGKYDLNSQEWNNITNEAKDFISKLMEKDPNKRYNAEQALKHTWITQLKEDIEQSQIERVLKNIKSFKSISKIQFTIYQYIVNQLITQEDKSELIKIFKFLDTNDDGLLSKQELLVGLKMIMNEYEAVEQVGIIMNNLDQNNSGYIDYSEFIAASINRSELLSYDRITNIFKMIDKDCNGLINANDLKLIFGNGQISDQIWIQLIQEINNNKEDINFQDFQGFIHNIIY